MSITQEYARLIKQFDDAPDRFEMTVKEVYTNILSDGSTALDLGAHTGKHTIPMARAVGATGRLFAFEPIQEKFIQLLENIRASNLSNVGAFNVCCSSENGLVEFIYLPTDPGKSAIHVRESLEHDSVDKIVRPCLAVQLDAFLSDLYSLDFVKMDIEGAELDALRGASELIARTKPIIHIEIGPPSLDAFGASPAAIYDLLRRAGYDLMDVFGIALPSEEIFLESVRTRGAYDYFAVHKGSAHQETVRILSNGMWGL